MYFLDTNTCIYFLNGQSTGIRDKLLSLPPVEVKIPSIVKAELVFGAYKSRHKEENIKKIDAFLDPFEVIPFTESVAYTYAEVRSSGEKTGKIVGPNDLLIASIVIFHDGILITNNIEEFKRIENLKIESWKQVEL